MSSSINPLDFRNPRCVRCQINYPDIYFTCLVDTCDFVMEQHCVLDHGDKFFIWNEEEETLPF